jgi:hypothetical protein
VRQKKTPSKRGPQLTGRVDETEAFLRKIAQRCRRRAEAHRLIAPKPEDYRALASLEATAALAEGHARSLREPELPLQQ